jgi:hypothetical protein
MPPWRQDFRQDDGRYNGNARPSLRTVPIPGYPVPELTRWKLACPRTTSGLVFPGDRDATGERGPIDADKLLRNIPRRALRRAGAAEIPRHAPSRQHIDVGGGCPAKASPGDSGPCGCADDVGDLYPLNERNIPSPKGGRWGGEQVKRFGNRLGLRHPPAGNPKTFAKRPHHRQRWVIG